MAAGCIKGKTNNSRLIVSRQNEAVRLPKGSMNRNRTIAQQAGQRERRIARFLSSMSLAAAALPWTLGDQPQNRNEPQLNRALNVLSPFDSVSRDRSSSIGFEAFDDQVLPLAMKDRRKQCTVS